MQESRGHSSHGWLYLHHFSTSQGWRPAFVLQPPHLVLKPASSRPFYQDLVFRQPPASSAAVDQHHNQISAFRWWADAVTNIAILGITSRHKSLLMKDLQPPDRIEQPMNTSQRTTYCPALLFADSQEEPTWRDEMDESEYRHRFIIGGVHRDVAHMLVCPQWNEWLGIC